MSNSISITLSYNKGYCDVAITYNKEDYKIPCDWTYKAHCIRTFDYSSILAALCDYEQKKFEVTGVYLGRPSFPTKVAIENFCPESHGKKKVGDLKDAITLLANWSLDKKDELKRICQEIINESKEIDSYIDLDDV